MSKKPQPTTHELDAAGMPVGRLASRIALLLRGKDQATFNPAVDPGHAVRVINARLLSFTGRKLAQKDYHHHSMYPGGLKRVPMKKVFEHNPAEVIRHAVTGMLPKNNRRKEYLKRLAIEN